MEKLTFNTLKKDIFNIYTAAKINESIQIKDWIESIITDEMVNGEIKNVPIKIIGISYHNPVLTEVPPIFKEFYSSYTFESLRNWYLNIPSEDQIKTDFETFIPHHIEWSRKNEKNLVWGNGDLAISYGTVMFQNYPRLFYGINTADYNDIYDHFRVLPKLTAKECAVIEKTIKENFSDKIVIQANENGISIGLLCRQEFETVKKSMIAVLLRLFNSQKNKFNKNKNITKTNSKQTIKQLKSIIKTKANQMTKEDLTKLLEQMNG